MDTRHWRAACGAAAWLVCLAAPVRPAAAQILESLATGEILAGQSTSDSASTTVVFLGDVLPGAPTNTLTTRVGFNVNADAAPGLVAIEVALLSFDIRFDGRSCGQLRPQFRLPAGADGCSVSRIRNASGR